MLLRGALPWTVRYTCTLGPGRRLADYDMEQQGEIIADYDNPRLLGHPTVEAGPTGVPVAATSALNWIFLVGGGRFDHVNG